MTYYNIYTDYIYDPITKTVTISINETGKIN